MRKLILFVILVNLFSFCHAGLVHTKIIGVGQTDNGFVGIPADLYVEVKPGSGHVFVDTMPLTKIDTQASARLAKEVACEELEVDCSKYDFFYIIRSEYSIIGGPSAGAAMTIATIAALTNTTLNQDVAITGTINPDGSIGPVGSVLEKLEAAHRIGITLFLVPKEESQVVVNGENLDISKKALVEWGMDVKEVYDVLEAYKYFSGYEIKKEDVSNVDIASKKYDEVMNYLSKELISDAETKFNEVQKFFKLSTVPLDKHDQIKENLKDSEDALSEAKNLYEKEKYYSSASLAVRSMIYSYYAENQIKYFENGKEEIKISLDNLESDVSKFEKIYMENKGIDCLTDVEIFAVAIERISESIETVNKSREFLNDGDIDAAIYYLSYGQVRKNTAYTWFTLINKFTGNESLVFEQEKLKTLAQEKIEQGRNAIIYAKTMVSNEFLQSASKRLEKAEKAYYEGNYVFTIFEASKARAEANLAMEVRTVASNETLDYLFNSLESDSLRAIEKAEKQGLLPVLAISYYEYGKTLRDKNKGSSLIFLSYSKEMSRISIDLTKAISGVNLIPTPKVEVEKYYEKLVKVEYKKQITNSLLLLFTGILCGFAISFLFKK